MNDAKKTRNTHGKPATHGGLANYRSQLPREDHTLRIDQPPIEDPVTEGRPVSHESSATHDWVATYRGEVHPDRC